MQLCHVTTTEEARHFAIAGETRREYFIGQALFISATKLGVSLKGSSRGGVNDRLCGGWFDARDNKTFYSDRAPSSPRCTATVLLIDRGRVLAGPFDLTRHAKIPMSVQKQLAAAGFSYCTRDDENDYDDEATIPFDTAKLRGFREQVAQMVRYGFAHDDLAAVLAEEFHSY